MDFPRPLCGTPPFAGGLPELTNQAGHAPEGCINVKDGYARAILFARTNRRV